MVFVKKPKFSKVTIHPTVLLGVVDHLTRVVGSSGKDRVIGVLLGNVVNGFIDVRNCFGVPFTEQLQEDLWVLDVDYAEEMMKMLRKVGIKDNVVGWYQTGFDMRMNDIEINNRFKALNPDCIVVLVDPRPKDLGCPAKAFVAVDEIHDDGSPVCQSFKNLDIEIIADHSEEVCIEHLLRDIGKDDVTSSVHHATSNINSLHALENYLREISSYLGDVINGKLSLNSEILEQIQSILYELPLVYTSDVSKALSLQCTDDSSLILLSVLVRAVLAINKMMNNKFHTQILEKRLANKENEKKQTPIAKVVDVKENGNIK